MSVCPASCNVAVLVQCLADNVEGAEVFAIRAAHVGQIVQLVSGRSASGVRAGRAGALGEGPA